MLSFVLAQIKCRVAEGGRLEGVRLGLAQHPAVQTAARLNRALQQRQQTPLEIELESGRRIQYLLCFIQHLLTFLTTVAIGDCRESLSLAVFLRPICTITRAPPH